ncbi:MAG TPA: GNAT family N-acetyltransferase [Thermoanaerobaculia bacterium]|jgi:RimJ/RimL family protein N-acetyltransferase|nr:GNAT family N-acetyltransferase [Thermoanaerobaculia bacterium]
MAEPSIQLRRGEKADAPALAEFAARIFSDTFAADNRPEDMEAHLADRFGVRQQTEELSHPGIITIVAEEGGRLIAYTQIRRIPPPDCVTGEEPVELGRFYVDRPWQGRGLAQRLMATAQDAGRELGGQTFWLCVWERNLRAIAFYEKCGFRDVGAKEYWLGSDQQSDRVMVMDIART